jgi:uridine kinase
VSDAHAAASVFARDRLRDGPRGLYGVTGPAGAGKSTFAAALSAVTGASAYAADLRFIGDSQQRRDLLARKRLHSIEAYRDSANQFNWWDWTQIATDLQALEAGVPLDLAGAYDRATGRADAVIRVAATPRLIFDGAILGPPSLLARLKTVFFLCAPPETRLARLISKDRARRSVADIAARFLITEMSETMHYRLLFESCGDRIVFLDAASGQPCAAPVLASEGYVPVPTSIG